MLKGSVLAAGFGGVALGGVQSYHEDHMLGASLDMRAVGPAAEWRAGLAAARAEMLRLESVLSGWRADSELSALNQAERFEASPDLFALIVEAERLRMLTRGAFSPRLGVAIKLRRKGGVKDGDVMRAVSEAESGLVRFDPQTRTIAKSAAIQFDVDGVAKGYVLDRALIAARRAAPGLRGLLIDIGGDIATWGDGPADGAWRVAVARAGDVADNGRPAGVALLRNQAIATSGRGFRDIGGDHHILDPRTGAPAAATQATAIAPGAMLADALATAFSVSAAPDSLDLADALPGIAVSVADLDGAAASNARWRVYANTQPQPCDTVAQAAWPKGFKLDVEIEIAKPKEADFKRQYVSVWISDEQKRLVKTLLILGDKPRWRESNYIWWRRFERLNADAVHAVSKPTRMPGKYKLRWDGMDDAGQPVRQGKYILNIEASREHGGHGFQSIPLEIGAQAFDAEVDATQELGPARARFGVSK